MAGMPYNRMQNLNINGATCENKFYHYCYVCNTQLNSCKQALLHCSGKRHRKKLQFLQSRKNGQFGGAAETDHNAFQFPPPSAVALPPPPGTHLGQLTNVPPPALVTANGAAGSVTPALVAALPAASTSPAHVSPATPAPPGCFYPVMTPVEHWLTPAPPTFVHFHGGQFGTVPSNPPVFRQQNNGSHLHPMPPPRSLKPFFVSEHGGPHALQPRPLLRYHESLASTGSSSPIMLTDASARGSGSSTGTRSAVISPSETSSISSESLISRKTRLLYRCQVCQRQFVTNTQLQVHLQASRHYKQYLLQAASYMERTGDSSETESWVSSSSIYYCMFCNIAVNSPAHLEAHIASHRFKRIPMSAVRAHSRSSSTSSETRGELIMDSGYVSGSGDELICISHPTPDKPTAKFRCQICNIFLNSPAQAKQHLSSQRHVQRVSNIRQSFRRKSCINFKRKQPVEQQSQKNQINEQNKECTDQVVAGVDGPTATRSLDTPSPDDDLVDVLADQNDIDDDNVTLIIRCHSF